MRTTPTRTIELTTTEAVALGVLAEGERSGYDLLKRVESSVGHIWSPAKSQLYAVLPRLVESGLARRRMVRQTSRPDKQLYRLTPAGKQAVRAWLEHASPRSFDELMLKVFFAKLVPRAGLPDDVRTVGERVHPDRIRMKDTPVRGIEWEDPRVPVADPGHGTEAHQPDEQLVIVE